MNRIQKNKQTSAFFRNIKRKKGNETLYATGIMTSWFILNCWSKELLLRRDCLALVLHLLPSFFLIHHKTIPVLVISSYVNEAQEKNLSYEVPRKKKEINGANKRYFLEEQGQFSKRLFLLYRTTYN